MTIVDEAARRALSRITITLAGCWQWTGPLRKDGYAQLSVNGVNRLAHRVIREALVEPIPPFLVLDHLCCNRACVNPDHLEPVEQAINTRRGRASEATKAMFRDMWAERTHCRRGHELAEVGFVVRVRGGYETHACRECVREDKRATHARLMADPGRRARKQAQNRAAVQKYRSLKGSAK